MAGLAYMQPLSAQGKLKVFILAGQSNMEGQGEMTNGPKGTLKYLVDNDKNGTYKHLVDAKGAWAARNDVWIHSEGAAQGTFNKWLSAGQGTNDHCIGPELEFGNVMGEYFAEPVLIIKTAWGGKSLAVDFRPPSSGKAVGPYYTQMIQIVKTTLADIKKVYPAYDGRPYEIAGFGWHQGWNDGGSDSMANEYAKNMVNFIKDVRISLQAPNMAFVIANSGFNGFNKAPDVWQKRLQDVIMPAQNAAATNADLKGTVLTVDTRACWRTKEESPADQDYHWNRSAESYYLIGDGIGKDMIQLMPKSTGVTLQPNRKSGSRLFGGWDETTLLISMAGKRVDVRGKVLAPKP
jgi:alpha-galactosidase